MSWEDVLKMPRGDRKNATWLEWLKFSVSRNALCL